LLDLSAAFDTVDHKILCDRLHSLGVTGNALKGIQMYLTSRTQSVMIRTGMSSPKPVNYGVPQGSVLGPLLFSCYLSGISSIFAKHNCNYLIYADDTQLWKSCHISDLAITISSLEECIEDVRICLTNSKLLLNPDKVEVILLGTKQLIKQCPSPVIHIDGMAVRSKSVVRDLGVFLDNHLTFEKHISQVSFSAFAHLRTIAKVSKSLTPSMLSMLAHALVVTRISYCSSIYHKVTKQQLARLQRILSAALRLINKQLLTRRGDHLQQLHLLPIEKMVFLRVASLIFSIIKSGLPKYLSEEVQVSTSQNLRSADRVNLQVPRLKSAFGSRAFSAFAPAVWNSIPVEIRKSRSIISFKEKLLNFINTPH
jgi:hypothetical protein